MNKLMLKGEVAACLILMCLLMVQSCKKDLLQPNSNVLTSSLSIAEAKKYFETTVKPSLKSKTLLSKGVTKPSTNDESIAEILDNKEAIWESAYQKLISTGNAVKIPLDFGKTYSVVDVGKKELIPFGSLNYLFMYKDSLQQIHAEWVILLPDKAWLYGKREQYTGKIVVKDWEGNFIKAYDYKGMIPAKSMSLIPGKSSNNMTNSLPETAEPPVDPLDPTSPDVWVICITKCHEFCEQNIVDSRKCIIIRNPEDPENGGGGGGGGGSSGNGGSGSNGGSVGGGSNGGTSGADYFPPNGPSCSSDPGYTKPNYPAPDGYSWIMPCEGPGAVPTPSGPTIPVVDNEHSPVNLPSDFDVQYDQEWYDVEDELGLIDAELLQQGVPNTDPIPEGYYIKGTGIDMTPAMPRNGRTVYGDPRNAKYFWEELIKKRPEMFSEDNRNFISANDFRSVKVDNQWVKYNPTHQAYLKNQLVHHHHKQRNMAFAIPAKVHQKWTAILHRIRASGKIPKLGGRLNSMGPFLQIFSIITDIRTGNPDAFVNGFGAMDEMGKLYKEPIQNFYFEITEQKVFKNRSGTVTRAIVTYDAFEDYVWDEDEKRYMGVLKIATYVEDIDVINHRTNSLTKVN